VKPLSIVSIRSPEKRSMDTGAIVKIGLVQREQELNCRVSFEPDIGH
jgi:hypothetical protein